MDLKLLDKVAIITGSSRGIGKAIAENLASYGCKIALISRNINDLEKVKSNISTDNIVCFDCDTTNINIKIINVVCLITLSCLKNFRNQFTFIDCYITSNISVVCIHCHIVIC